MWCRRAHVHDCPTVTGNAHRPQLVLQAQRRSEERDVDGRPGIAEVELVQEILLHHSDRVVACEVETPEPLDRRRHAPRHVVFPRDVSGDRHSGAAGGDDQRGRLLGGRRVDVVHRDTRAVRRQRQRDVRPSPRPAPVTRPARPSRRRAVVIGALTRCVDPSRI